MKRLIKAAFIALSLATAVAAPTTASAQWFHGPWHHHGRWHHHHHRGWHPGPAAAFGALTGLALGSAIAASARPTYVVSAPPIYALPTVGRTCVTDTWREWVPGWGWQVHRRTTCH